MVECDNCIWLLTELWIERGYGITDQEEFCMHDKRNELSPTEDRTCKYAEEGYPREEVHYT